MTDCDVRIRRILEENSVVLFMKGVPEEPRCGYSAVSARILQALGVTFRGIDVLQDPELREGIKTFSQWPTIPQLYVKEEFLGGCDILQEMFANGQLKDILRKKGLL